MGLFNGKKEKNKERIKDQENLASEEIEIIEQEIKAKNIEKGKDKDKQVIINELVESIINEFITKNSFIVNAVERGVEKKEKLDEKVLEYINYAHKVLDLTEDDKLQALNDFNTYVYGYGPLQKLIDDPDISDIKILDYNNINVKIKGKRQPYPSVRFNDVESMDRYINFMAVKNKVPLSEITAIQKITDRKTSDKFILRINLKSKFITSVDHGYLHIRKIPKEKYSMDQLESLKMFNSEVKEYIKEACEAGLSIFHGGVGGSGKTSLINAEIEEISHETSGLVMQESEELFSKNHPLFMFDKVVETKAESNFSYSLNRLIINGLLTDIECFIIGEIKGEEAWDLINAIFTGASGISSVHTATATEIIDKLIHYVRTSKHASVMTDEQLLKMFVHLDVLIFMDKFKVIEIAEVEGYDVENKRLIYNKVFEFKIEDKDGKKIGTWKRVNQSCSKIKRKIAYRRDMKEVI